MTEKDFETSNLYFVAACVSYGATVSRTEKVSERRLVFSVDNCPEFVFIKSGDEVEERVVSSFNDILLLFTSRQLMFPPTYPESIRAMKTLIYDR